MKLWHTWLDTGFSPCTGSPPSPELQDYMSGTENRDKRSQEEQEEDDMGQAAVPFTRSLQTLVLLSTKDLLTLDGN